MKTKIVVCTIMLLSLMGKGFSDEQKRGFYFDVGLGLGSVSYGEEFDNYLKLIEAFGAERVTVYIDLSLGYSVTKNAYVIGSISGFGDRFEYEQEYSQINTYLSSIGVRYYPYNTGLQIGADFGLGAIVFASSEEDDDLTMSQSGSGFKVTVAYDFDSTLQGPAMILGGAFLVDIIKSDLVNGLAGYIKFVYK